MQEMTCDEVRDAAPGYALDIIEPVDRLAFTAHLDWCSACRHEVVRVQQSADRLLALESCDPVDPWAPGVRPARRRFRTVVALAAAALLVFGSTFGSEIYQSDTATRTPTSAAAIIQGGRPVGRVGIYAGQPNQVVVSVRGLAGEGRITCDLVTSNGTIPIGTFELFKGTGYWIANVDTSTLIVTGIRLVDGTGATAATAAFASAV